MFAIFSSRLSKVLFDDEEPEPLSDQGNMILTAKGGKKCSNQGCHSISSSAFQNFIAQILKREVTALFLD